jgi:predicted phosphodiesterase
MEVLAHIGVIGDVHACDSRLASLLGDLAQRELDAIWCVGDIVTGPGDPDRCVELLQSAGTLTVRGNHDRWCLEGARPMFPDGHRLEQLQPATQAYLRALPPMHEAVAPDGTPVLLCHGLAANDMNGLSVDDFGYALDVNDDLVHLREGGRRIVVKGHRHHASIWRLPPLTLIDAGTLCEDHTDRCGVVLDLAAMQATPLVLADGVVREAATVAVAA